MWQQLWSKKEIDLTICLKFIGKTIFGSKILSFNLMIHKK